MPRRQPLLSVPLVVGLAAVLSGCSAGADHREADATAQRVVSAISYPRQPDAISWARAAADRVVVLRAEDLPLRSDDASLSARARLLFDVHLDSSQDVFGEHPATDTCYTIAFNTYGAIGGPERIGCPHELPPLRIPPPAPRAVVPPRFDRVPERLLAHQSADATTRSLRAAVSARLPRSRADVDTAVSGAALAVAVHDDEGRCLLGSRRAGRVRVQYAPRERVLPGELSCDAATAAGPLVRPAH